MSNTKSPDSDAGDSDVGVGADAAMTADPVVPAPADELVGQPSDDARPHDEPRGVGDRRRFGLMAGVAFVVLVLDQVTKIWAVATLADRNIDLFWTARLHLIRNTGSAFGLGTQFGRWLALVVCAVVVALVAYSRRIQDRGMLLLFGAIIGGALGNLIDRALRADNGFMSGGVIDFIDFQWWPVFNVADMAVVLGAMGLMAMSLGEPK